MNESKTIFLIRGTSGAGKTTFVKKVAQDSDLVVANDDFMVNENGEYVFDWKRLGEVSEKCRKAVKNAMEKGTPRIFVHNTFTTTDEMGPYFELAKEFGYDIFTVIVENRGGWKSEHGTPESTREKQRARFDIQL